MVAAAARNRAERRAAHAHKVRKGGDDRDDRKGQSQPSQGQCRRLRDMADIHPVHHIIKNIDQLRDRHRQRKAHDIAPHTAF